MRVYLRAQPCITCDQPLYVLDGIVWDYGPPYQSSHLKEMSELSEGDILSTRIVPRQEAEQRYGVTATRNGVIEIVTRFGAVPPDWTGTLPPALSVLSRAPEDAQADAWVYVREPSPLKAVDVFGRRVWTATVDGGRFSIPTAYWPPGIYQIRVQAHRETAHARLVVL